MSSTDPRMLLELYLLGELDETEARTVEAWLAESPERRKELEAARRNHEALEAGLAPPAGAGLVAEQIVSRLATVRPHGPRASWRRVAAVAAAGVGALAALVLTALPRRHRPQQTTSEHTVATRPVTARSDYPLPRAQGSYFLPCSNTLGRGAVVRAGAGGAVLELGGYCRLELAPGTVARLCGSRGQERVFLEEGIVTCEVDHGLGEFAVETGFCTVAALGTRFTVQLQARQDADDAQQKEALVRILAGAALVTSAWGQELLVAR